MINCENRFHFIPRHTIVVDNYDFMSDDRSSVARPFVFRFRKIIFVNFNKFSANLVCAFILWKSGLGIAWILCGRLHA